MITRHKDSHLDHQLTSEHVKFVLGLDPSAHGDPSEPVRTFTVEMPEHLAPLPCGLYGPKMGDEPVAEADVTYAVRGKRKGESRLVARPMRESRLLAVVAGPHDGHDWVLFTSYGGPVMPREAFEDDSEETKEVWGEHALSSEA
jgi:hypothetical protein